MFIPYTHKQLQLMADNTHVHTLTTQNNIRYTGDAYISPIWSLITGSDLLAVLQYIWT